MIFNVNMGGMPPPFDINTPVAPNLITAQDGSSHLICPRCGRAINTFEYDDAKDKWFLADKCIVCGQAIYDEQRHEQ